MRPGALRGISAGVWGRGLFCGVGGVPPLIPPTGTGNGRAFGYVLGEFEGRAGGTGFGMGSRGTGTGRAPGIGSGTIGRGGGT